MKEIEVELLTIFIKLNTCVVYDERMSPKDFQCEGSKLKVNRNKLVNMIESQPRIQIDLDILTFMIFYLLLISALDA